MESINSKEMIRLKQIWYKKKFTETFDEFIILFEQIPKFCYYCKITENEIDFLITNNLLHTKRFKTRGRKLEFERKKPNEEYSNIENIVLCCYWCNNAKTDTFTELEFKEIGKTLNIIWKERLNSIKK